MGFLSARKEKGARTAFRGKLRLISVLVMPSNTSCMRASIRIVQEKLAETYVNFVG